MGSLLGTVMRRQLKGGVGSSDLVVTSVSDSEGRLVQTYIFARTL
jgi:hypothetical protein